MKEPSADWIQGFQIGCLFSAIVWMIVTSIYAATQP